MRRQTNTARADEIITRELAALAEQHGGTLPKGYANRIVETLREEGAGMRRTSALKSIREWAAYLQTPGVVVRTNPERYVTQRAHVGKPLKQQAALGVVSLMRRDSLSLTAAVKRHNSERPENRISAKTVQALVPKALQKRGRTWTATRYDRYARTTDAITTRGVIRFTVHDSRTASLINRHRNAVTAYLENQADASVLRPFQGKHFRVNKRAYVLETDTDVLEQLGMGGEFDDLVVGSGQEIAA